MALGTWRCVFTQHCFFLFRRLVKGSFLTCSFFFCFLCSQCRIHADGAESGLGSAASAQAGLRPQADKGSDRPEREAAAYVAHLLCGQPPTRRPYEGTVGGNDGTQSACDQGVVSEQEVQRQEKKHYDEAVTTARESKCLSSFYLLPIITRKYTVSYSLLLARHDAVIL